MANSFNPAIDYKPIVDEYFEKYDLTNVFDKTAEYIGNGQYKILKITVGGLGSYTRNDGTAGSVANSFAGNSVGTTWETITANVERSTSISVDKMDDLESLGKAFDGAIKQFLQKAVIERMARRHAAIASSNKVQKVEVTLTDATSTTTALRAASNYMDNKWVPEADRVLIIRKSLLNAYEDLNSYVSKMILGNFGTIIGVPDDVMNEKITLSATNGFSVDQDSRVIDFIVAQKDAVVTGNYWEAHYYDENQVTTFLGSLYNYFEKPLDAYIYDNKADGVYVALEAAAVVPEG